MAKYNYSDEEIRAGLELAATTNILSASKELHVGRATIYRWINRFPELWSDLNAGREKPQYGFGDQLERLAERYTEAEHEALDKVDKLLEESEQLDAKELAALIKAMGSSRAVAAAGARAEKGQHDVIEHQINFPQLEQAMAALLEQTAQPPAIPATATEID